MLVFGIYGAIMIDSVVDKLQFLAQILSVMVAILMVYVIGIQAETMRHQTAILNRQANDVSIQSEVLQDQAKILRRQAEILELEKKPMLIFESRAMDIGGTIFEIIITNISKYPVLIEKVYYKLYYTTDETKEVNLKSIQEKLEHIIIGPGKEKKVDLITGGLITIEVSNLYYRDLKMIFEYDTNDRKVKLIGEK